MRAISGRYGEDCFVRIHRVRIQRGGVDERRLGLSIGTTNLVAASGDLAPITRRSVLTLFNDRAPEVGEYAGPNQPRLVLTGFVERVGDPVPLVASDGSSHRGEIVLVEALDAIGRAAAVGRPSRSPSPRTGDPASSERCAARCGPSPAWRRGAFRRT